MRRVPIAATRPALLALQDSFRKDTHIAKADLPVAELSGRDNAFPFTFTVTLAPVTSAATPTPNQGAR